MEQEQVKTNEQIDDEAVVTEQQQKTMKRFKEKLETIKVDVEHNLDVCRNLHNHLVDERHSKGYRYRAGTIVMMIGVGIVKISMLTEGIVIHFIADVIGYGLHGLGLIVFAKLVEEGGNDNHESTRNNQQS